jgi:hypothetical protein
MKKFPRLIAVVLAVATICVGAMAQSVIYRCGNEYLNDAAVAVARGCQVVKGGHITVVPGTRVNRVEKKVVSSPAVANVHKSTDDVDQRRRDMDAYSILSAELKTAQDRLAEQQQAYNHGAPDKLASEAQHPQRYLDRIHELKEGIQRYTGDIAALKREIARLPATP